MSLIHSFEEGGPFMYGILAFGVCSLAFIVDRVRALYLEKRADSFQVRQTLMGYLGRGDLSGAQAYVRTLPSHGFTGILQKAVALREKWGGEEELQSRMDEALTDEVLRIDRRTGFLAMFGNVATLLGLLGTITGMIRSFSAVAASNPADRAMLLSQGISEAMNCTAFGLLVAIPALVCYAIFQARTDKLVSELTNATAKTYHDLIFLFEPGKEPKPEPAS